MSIKTALDAIKPEGKLITDTEKMLRAQLNKEPRKSAFRMNRLAFAACLALVMGTLSISAFAYYQTPVSYVSVDINPSLRLGINRFDRVVSVEPYSVETENILEGTKLYGQKPSTAIAAIIKSAENNGYIKNDGSTVVSVVAGGKEEERTEKVLNECVEGVSDTNKQVAVYSDKASDALRKEADSLSISAGKLKLIKMIQKLDATATVEEYRDDSVTFLIDQLDYMTSDQYKGSTKEAKDSIQTEIQKSNTHIDEKEEKSNSSKHEKEEPNEQKEKKDKEQDSSKKDKTKESSKKDKTENEKKQPAGNDEGKGNSNKETSSQPNQSVSSEDKNNDGKSNELIERRSSEKEHSNSKKDKPSKDSKKRPSKKGDD